MIRRLLRTLPAYLSVVALYFLVPFLQEGSSIKPLWHFLSFAQNLSLDLVPGKTFSAPWSLCVEEQSYLVCPLVVALVAIRPSLFEVVAAVIAVLMPGICIRGYLWMHEVTTLSHGEVIVSGPRFMTFVYYPTWTRLDGQLAGVVAALVQTLRPN